LSYLIEKKSDVLNLTLDGFEGPIDLLLSLARDQKIDLAKLSILPLAEQYLKFLGYVIKKDIDIAAEYLVMGAWLVFLKSKILLPDDNSEDLNNAEEMSERLEFQMRRLEAIQKVSQLLFKKHQLGTHFFKRGNPEVIVSNQKIQYNLNLFDLIKSYGMIVSNENSKSILIASSKLYSIEDAIKRLKSLIIKSSGWKDFLEFIPHYIKDNLENRSAIASHFVASLELVKEGDVYLRQDKYYDKILLSSKTK
jgi:segregation and condensation protein A